MKSPPCSDASIGSQIWRYEFDDLKPAEREWFEDHLMVCAACRAEISKMRPMIDAIRSSRSALLSQLQTDGITFDSIRNQIRTENAHAVRRETPLESWPSRLIQGLSSGRRPWLLAPAMGVTAAVVLVIFLSHSRSAYLDLLEFQPVLYERNTARGDELQEKGDLLSEGMDAYCAGDYGKAASRLSRVVTRDPANDNGWLYLGVSYYLRREPRPAIKALRHAALSAQTDIHDTGQWYLAQAFLLNNQADSALARIYGLDRNSRWWPKADSVAARMKTRKAKP